MKKNILLGIAIVLATGSASAEPWLTTRSTALHAQPQADAAKVATLSENTKVDMVRRAGPWSEVKATSQTGWVRMFHIKPEEGASGAAPASAQPLANLSKARQSQNTTVAHGGNSWSAEEIARANPNPAEFSKMQRNAVAKGTGQTFAQRSNLAALQVEYLEGSSSSFSPSGTQNETQPMGM